MNGYERRRKVKMENILNTAFKLFFTHGVNNVSISEIAKSAGVSQVSIYNFFESKENLVRQSIFTYYNSKLAEYEMLLDSKLSFREKVEKMLFDKKEAVDNYGEKLLEPSVWNDPAVQNFILEYYQAHSIPFILKFINQGKNEGFINPDLSDEAVLLYIGMFKDTILKTNLCKKDISDLSILFFYGLFGKPDHKK